jgi:hypothetical protein
MERLSRNPWKLTTFAVLLVLATALVTGVVVAKWSPSQTEPGAPAAGPPSQFGGNRAAAGGTLYGINEGNKTDEAYRAAYARCMRSRGFTD